jgi:hypothetical protein
LLQYILPCNGFITLFYSLTRPSTISSVKPWKSLRNANFYCGSGASHSLVSLPLWYPTPCPIHCESSRPIDRSMMRRCRIVSVFASRNDQIRLTDWIS